MEQDDRAPFMAVAYYLKPEYREMLSSVVHADGSIRPQTVTREDHPFMWDCIQAFKQHSGQGIVLNTSFNVRGQPIVESPEDALGCFYASGLDALAIGPFWIEKEAE
jgi:carbamoyltransferase